MKFCSTFVALTAVAVSWGVSAQTLEPERLSADELKKLDILLDGACRHYDKQGTECSRIAIGLLDKIGRINSEPPSSTHPLSSTP